METPNSLTLPDYTEHILAWRGWTITDDFYLQSYNEQYGLWGLVYTRARCRNGNHPHEKSPVHMCGGNTRGCGLYGVFDMRQIPGVTNGSPDYLIGLAAYWGKAFIGAEGIRAELAKPFCLIQSDTENVHPQRKEYDFNCRQIAHAYSIPILHINDAIEQFKQHLPMQALKRQEEKERVEAARINAKKKLTPAKLSDVLWRPDPNG